MANATFQANPLQIGDGPFHTQKFSISGTGVIKAGTPIKSADGLAGTVAAEVVDQSTVIGITAFDIDLSGGAVDDHILVTGQYSALAMTLGNMTVDGLNAALRLARTPIFIQ